MVLCRGHSAPTFWKGCFFSIAKCPRLYSSSSETSRVESFDITCASSGYITVDIHNSPLLTSPTTPLILYLPPTGSHLRSAHPQIPKILRSYPLASINYRWNYFPSPTKSASISISPSTPGSSQLLYSSPHFRNHPFPTPLHDTLHAFTWLTTSFLPTFWPSSTHNSSSPSRPESPYSTPIPDVLPRPIIIYGSHLGGALATSLALTECRASKQSPFNIGGLIVKDGVFDWTGVATSKSSRSLVSNSKSPTVHENKNTSTSRTRVHRTWDGQSLHKLRERLFSQPATCFDSFASPVLFFRTAGFKVPTRFPGAEPIHASSPASFPFSDASNLSLSDAEFIALSTVEFGSLRDPINTHLDDGKEAAQEMEVGGEEQRERMRKSNLKFPPRDSGLKIPRSLFLVSTDGVEEDEEEVDLGAQALEMVRLMRRSIVRHEFKERVLWDEELDPHAVSEERVRLAELDNGKGEGGVVEEWIEDCE